MRDRAHLPDADRGRFLLTQMIRIRKLEEAAAEQYSAGKIRGFLHLYIGEEAIAVGAISAMLPEEPIFATYREHGHALMRGIESGPIMAEMFGKTTGVSGGRGGSMHLFDKAHHFIGGSAIVAGAMPLAAGYALANKFKDRRIAAVCFFGEGAMAEGEFHETMNMAALWNLPVLFVCENNLYAMGSALERTESECKLCKKASSYGVYAQSVDGMDVLEVEEAVTRALNHAREGAPAFVECRTYRFRAHSMFDAELYRTKEEVDRWKEKDPILKFSNELLKAGLLTEVDLRDIEATANQEMIEAVKFAAESPLEDLAMLKRHVYSDKEDRL